MKTITIKGFDMYNVKKSLTGKDIDIIGDDRMEVSDGSHTFDELYQHRYTLYVALCRSIVMQNDIEINGINKIPIWRSQKHSDGELAFGGGWFLLGVGKEKGEQITYHLPIEKWEQTEFAETLDKAPEWDGHTSADVLERLKVL